MIAAFLSGFFLGASLIVAIGAQNAFVLRQGLLGKHVFVICLMCALSDALLIIVGVAGLGRYISGDVQLVRWVTLGGVIFLTIYGLNAFARAFKGSTLLPTGQAASLSGAMAACIAFTFLNPHVYLDTVILLGSLSSRYEGQMRLAYGAGATIASFIWFFGLGYGAQLLRPFFEKSRSWQVVDCLIGIIMITLATSLSVTL